MAQNQAIGDALPGVPVATSILDRISGAAFVFFAFHFFSKKFIVRPEKEIITPHLAAQRSADSRVENALKQPSQLEAMMGMQSSPDIRIFPTHDKDGFELGICSRDTLHTAV